MSAFFRFPFPHSREDRLRRRSNKFTTEIKVLRAQKITYDLFDLLVVLIVHAFKAIYGPVRHIQADRVLLLFVVKLCVGHVRKVKASYVQTIQADVKATRNHAVRLIENGIYLTVVAYNVSASRCRWCVTIIFCGAILAVELLDDLKDFLDAFLVEI